MIASPATNFPLITSSRWIGWDSSRGRVPSERSALMALNPKAMPTSGPRKPTSCTNGGSDWSMFFENFVAADVRQRTIESLAPTAPGQKVWRDMRVDPGDVHVVKNRYSALIPGSSNLERVLRGLGIENLLVAGTKTNVCCEATGRDAMMMDFRVVMVSDCLAALSDDEHRASLETFIQQFGDVMTSEEVVAVLSARPNRADAGE